MRAMRETECERERSLQLCQYAEWEGKETNGERSKKKKAVWRNRRRAEEGQEREWRVRHREVKKSRTVRKEQATGKGRTRARAESMRTSRIRVHESA